MQEKSTERQYLLIDDSVMALGGTALTLEALIEPNRANVNTVATEYFRFNESDDLFYIVGNCLTLSQESFESLYYLFQKGNFCKIEFDYGFCQYRGPYPHKHFTGKECDCPTYLPLEQLYKGITKNAKKIFYMSDQQRDIHLEHLPDLNKDKTVRLSSTFLNENYFSDEYFFKIFSEDIPTKTITPIAETTNLTRANAKRIYNNGQTNKEMKIISQVFILKLSNFSLQTANVSKRSSLRSPIFIR